MRSLSALENEYAFKLIFSRASPTRFTGSRAIAGRLEKPTPATAATGRQEACLRKARRLGISNGELIGGAFYRVSCNGRTIGNSTERNFRDIRRFNAASQNRWFKLLSLT